MIVAIDESAKIDSDPESSADSVNPGSAFSSLSALVSFCLLLLDIITMLRGSLESGFFDRIITTTGCSRTSVARLA